MTRINVVPVSELENMHLLAEYRELPRIFALATNYYNSPKRNDSSIPEEYLLGTGHVKFFYNKLLWLRNRQKEIIDELIKRNYNIQFNSPDALLQNCPVEYCNDYIVTDKALTLNRERIKIRLNEFYSRQVNKTKKS